PLYALDILLKSPLLLLLVPLIAVAVALLVSEPARTERNVALILFATAAIIGLTIEFVYLRDVFGNRMNTLFKFYYQMWVLWGLAAASGVWRPTFPIPTAWPDGREVAPAGRGRAAVLEPPSAGAIAQMIAAIPWVAVFLLLMLSGVMYSVYGPLNKLGTNPPI